MKQVNEAPQPPLINPNVDPGARGNHSSPWRKTQLTATRVLTSCPCAARFYCWPRYLFKQHHREPPYCDTTPSQLPGWIVAALTAQHLHHARSGDTGRLNRVREEADELDRRENKRHKRNVISAFRRFGCPGSCRRLCYCTDARQLFPVSGLHSLLVRQRPGYFQALNASDSHLTGNCYRKLQDSAPGQVVDQTPR